MDLPCAQWQEHVAYKWTGLEPVTKERFRSLLDVDEVFRCALTLTTQDDLDFLLSVSERRWTQKDAGRAARYRETGNCSFKIKDYAAAALHYSQGICFAPPGSEQLSLCYANRSAALYHLQLYQECVRDVDVALRSGYPPHLRHKLDQRRSLCLQHVSKLPRGERPSSVLGSAPRPPASVSFSLEKGRHLLAERRIEAGETILSERPYGCVLIPGDGEEGAGPVGAERRRCHRCLTETPRLLPCDGCSDSRYCSAACQQGAWEEHHRWECPLGAELRALGVMAQLALRVALKAGLKNVQTAREPMRSEDTRVHQPHPSDSYLGVFHLLHHLDNHRPPLRFLHAVTVATLYMMLRRAGPPPASWDLGEGAGEWGAEQCMMGSAVLRHLLQLRCNAQAVLALQDTGAADFSVQSCSEVRVATAIFPALSLLNHSCRPNTSLTFSTGAAADADAADTDARGSGEVELERSAGGVCVTVRASRVIDAGQEILHCYGPHSSRMETQERQRLLQEQYYFLCGCEACDSAPEGVQERSGAAGSGSEAGLVCFGCKAALKRSEVDGAAGGLTCSRRSCSQQVSSSEVSLRLQQIRADLQASVELMERHQPDQAVDLLRRTQAAAERILAETHPLQGQLDDATARAYATMGDWRKAARHLERSAAAVRSQYGDDSVELGQQLFKLAQLHFNGGARGPALSVIPRVRRLLRLHSGPNCPELQELQDMEECLRT